MGIAMQTSWGFLFGAGVGMVAEAEAQALGPTALELVQEMASVTSAPVDLFVNVPKPASSFVSLFAGGGSVSQKQHVVLMAGAIRRGWTGGSGKPGGKSDPDRAEGIRIEIEKLQRAGKEWQIILELAERFQPRIEQLIGLRLRDGRRALYSILDSRHRGLTVDQLRLQLLVLETALELRLEFRNITKLRRRMFLELKDPGRKKRQRRVTIDDAREKEQRKLQETAALDALLQNRLRDLERLGKYWSKVLELARNLREHLLNPQRKLTKREFLELKEAFAFTLELHHYGAKPEQVSRKLLYLIQLTFMSVPEIDLENALWGRSKRERGRA